MRPPLRYSSWIGGDRDGNPFVTVDVTRYALKENRNAIVARLDQRLNDLAQLVSLSSQEIAFPPAFLDRAGAAGGAVGRCGQAIGSAQRA